MSALIAAGPKAEGVRWDLSPIVSDGSSAKALLEDQITACEAFGKRYRGTVATLDAAAIAAALDELATIDNALSRVGSYVGLRRAVDVNDDEARDLEAVVEQGMVKAGNELRFFDLEWIAVEDDAAQRVIDDPAVEQNRHYLASQRRFRPHVLAENEERILSERSPAAVSAWQNLHEQILANVRVPFDDGAGEGEKERTIDEILSYVHTPDRAVRVAALEALYTALEPNTPTLAHCYDSLVADRLVVDRLRHHEHPMDARHLENELEPAAVEAMMTAIESRYDIAQRWFRRKAELLGVDKLKLADQYAPLGSGRTVGYEEARKEVDEAFAGFSAEIQAVSQAFFDEQRVDAEPRQGKRGGAFCASVAQDSRPYILLNYTDRVRDVMTMAHELGHGMHFALASQHQSALSMHAPLALCEVPSTFAELILFDRLLASETDEESRKALVRGELEDGFATVFRQTMMARFEQDAYGLRAEGQALTPDRLSERWIARNKQYYGDSIELPEGYRLGWSYIPHFIGTRFYTYAYAFAHLASLVLYARYREQGEAFVPEYIKFLETGGAASPGEQLAAFGVDLTDPGVWNLGLDEMERMLGLAG